MKYESPDTAKSEITSDFSYSTSSDEYIDNKIKNVLG
jgi:hypothetical protein